MSEQTSTGGGVFKWACFGLASVFAVAVLWLLYDLKSDLTRSLETTQATVAEANQAVATVNVKLPQIIDEVTKGTETLSELAEDVDLIKRVAGVPNEDTGRGIRSLAEYADEIQQVLAQQTEGQEAMILKEEIFGSDLAEYSSAEEFLIGLHKEMITFVLPVAKSKQEILYRACYSSPPRRVPFYIQLGDSEPVTLEAFIKEHHAESAELPAYE